MNNLIFRRKNIVIKTGNTNLEIKDTIEFMKKLSQFGFYLEVEDLNNLTKESADKSLEVLSKHFNVEKMKDKAFYINFPEQVKNMSNEEIYVNAILHYWLGFRRNDIKLERPKLTGTFKLKRLVLSDKNEEEVLLDILNNLFNQKVSFSKQDKEDINLMKDKVSITYDYNSISIKENKYFLLHKFNVEMNKDYFDTTTDILRYISYFHNDEDTSLSEKLKFGAIPRKTRRLVMKALNKMKGKEEDILRYKNEWKKLAHFVHPYEYPRYKTALKLFEFAINDNKVETFNSKVSEYMKTKNMYNLLYLLKTRPTEFLRKFDFMFREKIFSYVALDELINILPQASTAAILSLINKYLNGESEYVMYIPKATDMKFFTKKNNLEEVSEEMKNYVVNILKIELKRRFSDLYNLGKVYLDEELKYHNIPNQIRNVSKGSKVVARWSRFPIPNDKNCIRSFIHWKNIKNQSVDVDSAFTTLDKNGKILDSCSYSSIKSKYGTMIHSGDITSAPNGATEYVDIDLKETKKKIPNAKYLLMNVYSFSGQSMKDIPECFGGWMFREDLKSGELYEPKTAEHIFNFTNSGTSVLPMAIDLESNEVIWLDVNTTSAKISNNVNRDSESLKHLITGLESKKNYMSLYELFELHSDRYEIVNDKEEANVVFTELGIEEVLSGYLI